MGFLPLNEGGFLMFHYGFYHSIKGIKGFPVNFPMIQFCELQLVLEPRIATRKRFDEVISWDDYSK